MSAANLAVQSGAILLAPSDKPSTLALSQAERIEFALLISALPDLNLNLVDDEFLNHLELLSCQLPRRLGMALVNFRRRPSASGHLLIRNTPQDDRLPPTPSDGRPTAGKVTSVSEYVLLLSMLYLGEPISYLDEKEGNLIQNICPIKGKESLQENSGSSLLEFHTEDGFHPHKPDHLGLYCLRADHDHVALTSTASVRDVVHKLPSSAIDILRRPVFRIKMSSSFGQTATGHGRYSGMMPVLTGNIFEPDMCVDFFLMEGVSRSAQTALDLLRAQLLQAMHNYALQPGDLLIIDNRMAAHSRTPFQPKPASRSRSR